MIVTITPNPSIDRTLQLPALRRGEVIRVSGVSSEAGGKGINVGRLPFFGQHRTQRPAE